jgi:hypothetical protein
MCAQESGASRLARHFEPAFENAVTNGAGTNVA